jgi:hypothetical protein
VGLDKHHKGSPKYRHFVGDKFHAKHFNDQIADKHPRAQQSKLEKKFDKLFGVRFKGSDKSMHGHQKLVTSNHHIDGAALTSNKLRHDLGKHVGKHSRHPVNHYEDLHGKDADKFYAALGYRKSNQAHNLHSKLWSVQYARVGWTTTSSFKDSHVKNRWQRALDDQAVADHVFRTESHW